MIYYTEGDRVTIGMFFMVTVSDKIMQNYH